MKKGVLFSLAAVALLLVIRLIGEERTTHSAASPPLLLRVNEAPTITSSHRIGLNLGQWTSWGAQQYGQNVLMNPGFEGEIDRIVIIVSRADRNSFSDEAGWGYPDHTWDEAEFQVRTGKGMGHRGIVRNSVNSGKEGFPEYFSYDTLPRIDSGDIIVLTKVKRPDPPDQWWVARSSRVAIDPSMIRPNSPGTQSLKLIPSQTAPAEINSYLDTIGERAGKLLPVNKKWRFSVWAKGEKEGTELHTAFQRLNQTPPFFEKRFALTTEWQEYVIDFYPKDDGPPGVLKFSLSSTKPGNAVWIDDVFLGPYASSNFPFRQELVDLLTTLRPSFLREFAPIGDTWENRKAAPFERKTWLSRLSGGRHEPVYGYSLPEFLDLCEKVGANPWLIIPPTFSDYECKEFGKFLAEKASKSRFPEVILEFGNENWNWMFRPAGIPYEHEHGKLAEKTFDIITKAIGKQVNVRKLINGQYASPLAALAFLDQTPQADGLAVAPYFLYSLDKSTPDEGALKLLFQEDAGQLQQIADEVYSRDRSFAIYEVNLHTTQGNAKGFERNRLVAGAAAGSALAKRLIECLIAGADPIMVYTLSQHDTATWELKDFVHLWGIVRDFGPPPRLRPTGLAMELLNRTIDGDLHLVLPIDSSNPLTKKLTVTAFKGEKGWTLAAVSSHNSPLSLQVEFPKDLSLLPNQQFFLDASSPFDTNEEKEEVKISSRTVQIEDRIVRFTIPPWGFATLLFIQK